jgi:hypothetical protein
MVAIAIQGNNCHVNYPLLRRCCHARTQLHIANICWTSLLLSPPPLLFYISIFLSLSVYFCIHFPSFSLVVSPTLSFSFRAPICLSACLLVYLSPPSFLLAASVAAASMTIFQLSCRGPCARIISHQGKIGIIPTTASTEVPPPPTTTTAATIVYTLPPPIIHPHSSILHIQTSPLPLVPDISVHGIEYCTFSKHDMEYRTVLAQSVEYCIICTVNGFWSVHSVM